MRRRDDEFARVPYFAALMILTLLSVAGGVLPAAAQWAGQTELRDGVAHVHNPASPAGASVTVELEELWRLGGNSDDDDEFFGVIASLAQSDEDELYLLDSQLSEIKVYGVDGTYRRTIGREGDGPGEFRNASQMYLGPNGLVGVLQIFPGKIVQLTRLGDPADNFQLPKAEGSGFELVFVAQADEKRVVVAGRHQDMFDGKMRQVDYLKSFDAQGKELASFHTQPDESIFGNMKFVEREFVNFQRRWALAPNGSVMASLDYDDYALHHWDEAGKLMRVIHREHEPLERTDRERKRFKTMFDAFTRWNPNSTFEVSRTHQVVNQVFPRGDGSFWVQADRGTYALDEGVLASFDVFDAEGRYMKQLTLRGEGDSLDDGLYLIGDRVYVVTDQLSSMLAAMGVESEDEEMGEVEPVSVICYRMKGDTTIK